jgi:hypothetical protein
MISGSSITFFAANTLFRQQVPAMSADKDLTPSLSLQAIKQPR